MEKKFRQLNDFGLSKNGYHSQRGHDGISKKYLIPESIKKEFSLEGYDKICFVPQKSLDRYLICAIPKKGGPYLVIARPGSYEEMRGIIVKNELDEEGLVRLVKEEEKLL